MKYPILWPAPMKCPLELDTLRDCPVLEVELPSGDSALLITRMADVRRVMRDRRISRRIDRPGAARMCKGFTLFQQAGLDFDSAEFLEVKSRIASHLSMKKVEMMRGAIRVAAVELARSAYERGAPMDLYGEYAFPLSLSVICNVLGIPPDMRGCVKSWTDPILLPEDYEQEAIIRALAELWEYVEEFVCTKERMPQQDVTSVLVEEQLPRESTCRWIMAILVAGYEATAAALAGNMLALLESREQFVAVQRDHSLIKSAVEELLRWHLRAQSLASLRYATEAIEISGIAIPQGSSVIPCLESANRDEEAFANAAALDITRESNHHIAFGSGAHYCLGANLARVELQEGLRALLNAFPMMAVKENVKDEDWHEGLFFQGPRRALVHW